MFGLNGAIGTPTYTTHLLFLVFVNDVINSCPGASLCISADDTSVFPSNNCVNELVNCILGRIDIRLETRECRCLLFSLSKICV